MDVRGSPVTYLCNKTCQHHPLHGLVSSIEICYLSVTKTAASEPCEPPVDYARATPGVSTHIKAKTRLFTARRTFTYLPTIRVP